MPFRPRRLRSVAVFTNTMPTNAYRSSGRPEVTYAIERLVDAAAAELGIDRVTLRRKNLVRPEAMPYRNAVGMLYDCGRYEENMDWAMEIADWKGFPARRREAKKRGKLLGLGLANYVESSIGAPREQARIKVQPDGQAGPAHVDVVIGTQPAGQGHETSFSQVVSDLLHVPAESVRIIMGDTDVVSVGGGSHSGRSMRHAATVFSKAAVDLIARGKLIAAVVLGTAPEHCHLRRRPLRRARHQSHLRFSRTRQRSGAPHAAGSAQGRHRGRHRQRNARAGLSQRHRDLRGRDRSRHRGTWRSRAMPRSTTSAAASIR